MNSTFLGLHPEQWIDVGTSLLIIITTLVFGQWLVNQLLSLITRLLIRRSRTTLDDTILDALRPSLYWLIIVIAFEVGLIRLEFLPPAWESGLADLFYILYLMIGVISTGRLANNISIWYEDEVASKDETNQVEQLMPFLRRVVFIALGITGIVMILGHYGVDISALIATLGVGSLAIALAAQTALKDMISGFAIMVDRPFRIGDRIEIQELNTWGDVVDVGLRSSRIRTRDNRMVIIPNSVISQSLIVNYAYPDTKYRIQVQIGIEYGVDLEFARRTMIQAVQKVEGVLPDHKVEALFLEFGDSALLFRIRWWLDSYADTRRMIDKVNTALYNALNEAGITTPYPQIEVRMKENPNH